MRPMLAACALIIGAHLWSPPATAATAPVDPAPLGTIVGDARTVVFGEDSHGMEAVHAQIPAMFQYLVEKKHFRVIVFEVQWGVTEGFADFMASDRTTLGPLEQYWLNGAFVSEHTARLMVWIRDWNRRHPKDPIQIAGYQPEQPIRDFGVLLPFLDARLPAQAPTLRAGVAACRAADPKYATDLDFVIANGARMKDTKPTYTDDERSACLAGLDAITRALDTVKAGRGADATALTMAKLHAYSLHAYVATIRRAIDLWITHPDAPLAERMRWSMESYGGGDAARMHVYEQLKRVRFPRAKVFFWMHNWHAMRHASETDVIAGLDDGIPRGTVSLGERLAAAEGRKLVTIGNVVPCGTTCKEPEASVEPAFTERFGARPAWVDLRRGGDAAALPVRTAGTLLANHHGFGFSEVVLSRQFDAVLYLPGSAKLK